MDRYVLSLGTADLSVNHRINVLVGFYKWCQNNEIVFRAPFLFRECRTRNINSFSRSTVSNLRPTALKHIIRTEKVSVPSASLVSEIRAKAQTWRDQVIIDVLICTGLRCSELLNLEVSELIQVKVYTDEKPVLISITGKGNKMRKVYFPAGLVRTIQKFLSLDRRHTARSEQTNKIFLSKKGHRLSAAGLQYVLRKLGQSLSIRLHPHLLRHFFACHRLQYLTDLGLGDPLGQLQRELGHAHFMTTMRYLHLTDEIKAQIAADHQSFITHIAMGLDLQKSDWRSKILMTGLRKEDYGQRQ